ncbi:poly(3-hydroxyalkanoate) synthetase [Ralstonia pickettii DTP0602]|nr:poly(3-hydroxyalkanoate) synthetase [Ralstonia pickettii DTP0602]
MDAGKQLVHAQEVGIKTGLVLQKRLKNAQEALGRRMQAAAGDVEIGETGPGALSDVDSYNGFAYALDAAQRAILFWDTLRQRGNRFVEHAAEGLKPVLHFEYEFVLDGRQFERPVNYALLRITPPAGVTVDNARRPYVIIDPRAGHGPGIGGFKDDSQVGVALRAGHPVYFVIFFRDPEPGQTLLDVCEAEQRFVRKVRALHPDSPKPAIVGNCQGGWAAMMLAASSPDDTGPIVINGAPMSYWSGAWSEGEGDNPMRYAGGLLGGTWLASFTADLGNGKFDGAHLVQNFENLNPANSLWDKYYNLYNKADTEPPRFLEFEHWWGGYYLMNREEIEWITRNLFVGNKLWSGDVKDAGGKGFDLREIKSPIVLFASMGDNITPPQQAFNWVVDQYASTEEIKARGQVIVGMMHESIGHLGIFVSGKVAKKEHAQIVSVLKTIELLPPGLYGMVITERREKDEHGQKQYDVAFHEYRLEDIAARLNRFQRVDERPFEAVAALSDFNQRAYELFAQPFVQAMSNDMSARMLRAFHPLRVQNWALSDMNPWMAWLGPAADAVRANRQALAADNPLRQQEQAGAEMVSAMLDSYRAVRDAMTEASFFNIYANMFSQFLGDKAETRPGVPVITEPRELPEVKQALAAISEGGYVEALARVAFLLTHSGEPLPLSRLELRKELVTDYAEYLPALAPDAWRRIRGVQEIIVQYAPDQALKTLPALLNDPAERERLLTLLDKLSTDEHVLGSQPTPDQAAMLARIRAALAGKPERIRRAAG